MKTHAALPHIGYFKGVSEIVGGLVKQAIAYAATQNHAQDARKQNVFYISDLPVTKARVWEMLEPLRSQKVEQGKGGQIGQAIPVNGNRPQLQSNRVNLRVNQHGVRLCTLRHPNAQSASP